MNMPSLKRHRVTLCLLIVSFLSFQFNLFRVTSQENFKTFQVDSEALILDGIVHHRLIHRESGLGLYRRPFAPGHSDVDDSVYLSDRAQMDRSQETREFVPYRSQFGLQYYFYNYLYTTCHFSVQQLEAVTSLLMSFIVAAFFIALRRIVPNSAALGFCLTIALCPWTVWFARNLFWVEATWFLPCLVSLLLGNRRPTTSNQFTLTSLLFLATLIKFLCGYDFLTTICLAGLAPLAYYEARNGASMRKTVRQLGTASLAMFLAFICAIGLHVALLNSQEIPSPGSLQVSSTNSASVNKGGITEILKAAEKRTYSKDPDKVAREACQTGSGVLSSYPECVTAFKKSLQSNGFQVVGRYFIARHMVPWLSPGKVDDSESTVAKSAISNAKAGHFPEALRLARTLRGSTFVFLLSNAISAAMFLALNILVACVLYIRKRRSDLALLGIAFVSPISWYVAAKGYAQIHTHLCYVLWYLPYVPAAVALLLCEFSRQRHSNSPKWEPEASKLLAGSERRGQRR